MTARRLTHLTARLLLTLPLAACAAQPGPGQATGRPDAPAQASDARSAAAAPATAPASAAAPAAPVTQDTQAGTEARQTGSAATPRHTASGQAGHTGRAGGSATTAAGTAAGARAAAPSAAAAGTPAAGGTAAADTAATGTSPNNAAAAGTSAPDAPAPATSTPGAASTATPPDVVAPRPATPGAAVPPVTMPAGSPTGGLLQTLFALILVLAVLGALAWFLKRYGPRAGGGNANLRVVGSLNLGGRERIMVVEVGNQWIVVGASPGRINALATLPRQDGQNGDTDASHAADAALARQVNAAPGAHSFADWLKQTIDKRK